MCPWRLRDNNTECSMSGLRKSPHMFHQRLNKAELESHTTPKLWTPLWLKPKPWRGIAALGPHGCLFAGRNESNRGAKFKQRTSYAQGPVQCEEHAARHECRVVCLVRARGKPYSKLSAKGERKGVTLPIGRSGRSNCERSGARGAL